jgi:hypothetical protein
LLLARELVGWGPTAEVLTEANLLRARDMAEVWDETAQVCEIDADLSPPLNATAHAAHPPHPTHTAH